MRLHRPEHASAFQDLNTVIDLIAAKPCDQITENESIMFELAISWARHIRWPPEPKKDSDPVITEEMIGEFADNLRARGLIH
jgi:hypothetical protein